MRLHLALFALLTVAVGSGQAQKVDKERVREQRAAYLALSDDSAAARKLLEDLLKREPGNEPAKRLRAALP